MPIFKPLSDNDLIVLNRFILAALEEKEKTQALMLAHLQLNSHTLKVLRSELKYRSEAGLSLSESLSRLSGDLEIESIGRL